MQGFHLWQKGGRWGATAPGQAQQKSTGGVDSRAGRRDQGGLHAPGHIRPRLLSKPCCVAMTGAPHGRRLPRSTVRRALCNTTRVDQTDTAVDQKAKMVVEQQKQPTRRHLLGASPPFRGDRGLPTKSLVRTLCCARCRCNHSFLCRVHRHRPCMSSYPLPLGQGH